MFAGLPLERVEPQIVNPRLLLYASWTSSSTDLWLEFHVHWTLRASGGRFHEDG